MRVEVPWGTSKFKSMWSVSAGLMPNFCKNPFSLDVKKPLTLQGLGLVADWLRLLSDLVP